MTKECRNPNSEKPAEPGFCLFVIGVSFVVRHSSFGFHDHPYPRLRNTSLSYILTSFERACSLPQTLPPPPAPLRSRTKAPPPPQTAASSPLPASPTVPCPLPPFPPRV